MRVSYENVLNTFDDFAGSVAAGIISYYAQPYRVGTAEDAAILADNPRARDWEIIEGWVDEFVTEDSLAAATAEADRLLTLFNSGYNLYRVDGSRRWLQFEIGDEVNITWPHYGLNSGRNMIIVSIDDRINLEDGSEVESVEVLLFG